MDIKQATLIQIRDAAVNREKDYFRGAIVSTSVGLTIMILGIAFSNLWVAVGSIGIFAVLAGSSIYHLLRTRKYRAVLDKAINAQYGEQA